MWLPIYATPIERLSRYTVVFVASVVLLFLVAPLFVIVPLSFIALNCARDCRRRSPIVPR